MIWSQDRRETCLNMLIMGRWSIWLSCVECGCQDVLIDRGVCPGCSSWVCLFPICLSERRFMHQRQLKENLLPRLQVEHRPDPLLCLIREACHATRWVFGFAYAHPYNSSCFMTRMPPSQAKRFPKRFIPKVSIEWCRPIHSKQSCDVVVWNTGNDMHLTTSICHVHGITSITKGITGASPKLTLAHDRGR